MAGKLAGSWIKLGLKVKLKLSLKVDQQLIKVSLQSWPTVCTKVNRKLIKVGFEGWSTFGSKSWPEVNQSYLTKLIKSRTQVNKSITF